MASRAGIRLPQTLLDKLGDAPDGQSRSRNRPSRPKVSRKEARKQDRAEKKQRKASFFGSNANSLKRVAEIEHPESSKRKKARLQTTDVPEAIPVSSLVKPQSSKMTLAIISETNVQRKTKKKIGKGKATREQPVSVPRSQQEKNEDKYIAYLEGMLGNKGKKGSSYDKGFDEDGLGDLLMDLDTIGVPPVPKVAVDTESIETGDDDGDELSEISGDSWTGFGEAEIPEILESRATLGTSSPVPSSAIEKPPLGTLSPFLEYALEVSTVGAAVGSRYVPPHLRNRSQNNEETEILAKLSRQLKGLLNRLSEQNIAGILEEVEEVYRQHRRHDVTSLITSLIIDGISAHSILLDSYVVLHAAFVSSLYRIIGVEFAAFFVENVVSSYERHCGTLTTPDDSHDPDEETRGKECLNLVVLLSELYNFQVISCVLIYDTIRSLLDGELSEFSVELLLKLLRNSGQQLRQDDPSALKDIIQIVQNKTLAEGQDSSSSRTRFMVETLVNLKNNKTKRTATHHAGGDAVDRMKKFLSGLDKKRHVMAHDPLRVSLLDLHSSESKGKWWLVGAAWGGDPLVDRQEGPQQTTASSEDAVGNALLILAKKQGMNTDIRRSIFVVLMSSDDYIDACERLAQLNLSDVQQREVVRVILHCCGNEKTYNPYYTFVCQHLCQASHSYKVTLQFCLWDFLRDLGQASVGGAEIIKNIKDEDHGGFDIKTISPTRFKNIANAYAWWVAKDCITLSVLKPVDFTNLKARTRIFLSEFFQQLYINSQSSTPVLNSTIKDARLARNKATVLEIFMKATRIPTLALGLVHLLSSMFPKETTDEDPFMKWANDVALETLRTSLDLVPTL
ncbi:hypothetical protein BV25DRAFT_1928190 [Artomyces pyxidatus]|uniref:Uncharacterized protein n=1 Tax=Artomyces pyxidatus TaxID=48021 RepID=A0ACB8T928_9AGAM|nr:hypothetical protein BV25DRAFT_1928190 [Artomyces pyxidatus]